MARIQLNIKFFYEDVIYSNTLGYIPRHEAIKIPQLKIEEREQRPPIYEQVIPKAPGRPKKQIVMEDEVDQEPELDDNDDADNMEMEAEDAEGEIENYGEPDELEDDDQLDEIDNQIDNEMDNENQDNQFQNDNEEGEDDEDQMDDSNEDLSELSRSPNLNYSKYKTKRQKGEIDKLLELPLKKPRKDAKKFDEATELIRKQEKQRKRRQYTKKMNEAQEKATFDKILNETGRKFRQREQKEQKEVRDKEDRKIFKTLGNVPKITVKQNTSGTSIMLNRTSLFKADMMIQPNVRMTEICEICHQGIGKYTSKTGHKFCSVGCFKTLENEAIKLGKVC